MRILVFYHFYVQCMCEFSFVALQCVHSCHTIVAQETQEHTHILSFSVNNLVCILVHSQLLNVPVLLPQDGNLVPEQHRVQPHLGVQQGHETQPMTEDVHAGLSLGEVVWVGPPRRLRALDLENTRKTETGR